MLVVYSGKDTAAGGRQGPQTYFLRRSLLFSARELSWSSLGVVVCRCVLMMLQVSLRVYGGVFVVYPEKQ